MSDIQRYELNPDAEFDMGEWHKGDWVKYDDHIAEVETLKKDIKYWHKQLKGTQDAMDAYARQCDKLQARIDELEIIDDLLWDCDTYDPQDVQEMQYNVGKILEAKDEN